VRHKDLCRTAPIQAHEPEVISREPYYKLPEAGKEGPIAWQMHNKGLFDEYKDVRIEADPKADEFLTTK
jgi:hypothetical protein